MLRFLRAVPSIIRACGFDVHPRSEVSRRNPMPMPQPTTILIIDDNVNLARGFAQVLAGAGYGVHVAYTAAEGLQLAETRPLDAIIVDIHMPFVNGIGFLYRLRAMEAHRHTPVMVVTGTLVTAEMHADLRDLRTLVKIKPLGAAELLAEVRTLLAQERLEPDGAASPVRQRRAYLDPLDS